MLCRGAIELNRLHWNDGKVEVEMTSRKAQSITLVLPREITDIKADGATVESGASAGERKLTLPAGRKVSLAITLK